jgi:hypothetical protein
MRVEAGCMADFAESVKSELRVKSPPGPPATFALELSMRGLVMIGAFKG